MNPQINIRAACQNDEAAVLDIIERTGFFRPVELEVAREVFTEAIQMKPGSGYTYQSYVADSGDKAVGWICFGATPCTLGTFDIYWIAVDPDAQRQGIGAKLTRFAEEEIKKQHGRLIVVETSGTKRYDPTRKFYENLDYALAVRVPEFYAPGDDKCIYLKRLS